MKSYRMVLNNDEEKMEAISLFESLGYTVNRSNMKIWDNLRVFESGYGEFFMLDRKKGDLINMQQLKDLLVLHRNDVSDATHTGQLVGKYYVTENGETYNFNGLKWVSTGVPNRFLNPIIVEKFEDQMGLISGAEALRAIADGEHVEVRALGANWVDAKNSTHPFGMFFDKDFEFRLKPHTVKLEIEVPFSFEPKNGEHYWFICPYQENGYSWGHLYEGDRRIQFGAWRTEDEVKIIVKQMEKLKVIL